MGDFLKTRLSDAPFMRGDQWNREAVRQLNHVLGSTVDMKLGDREGAERARVQLTDAITRLAPTIAFQDGLRRALEIRGTDTYSDGERVSRLRGVATAVRDTYLHSLHGDFQQAVRIDVQADVLGVADDLLVEGLPTAAAVLAGLVLEQHLQELAQRSDIATRDSDGRRLKVETLNAELSRAGIIQKATQKNISAWYQIRNDATHGNSTAFSKKEVEIMVFGVRELMSR